MVQNALWHVFRCFYLRYVRYIAAKIGLIKGIHQLSEVLQSSLDSYFTASVGTLVLLLFH